MLNRNPVLEVNLTALCGCIATRSGQNMSLCFLLAGKVMLSVMTILPSKQSTLDFHSLCVCVWVMTVAHRGLQAKVISQKLELGLAITITWSV